MYAAAPAKGGGNSGISDHGAEYETGALLIDPIHDGYYSYVADYGMQNDDMSSLEPV